MGIHFCSRCADTLGELDSHQTIDSEAMDWLLSVIHWSELCNLLVPLLLTEAIRLCN